MAVNFRYIFLEDFMSELHKDHKCQCLEYNYLMVVLSKIFYPVVVVSGIYLTWWLYCLGYIYLVVVYKSRINLSVVVLFMIFLTSGCIV